MKPELVLIAAFAENRAIGLNNALLFHLPADLKHFKSLTYGHPVVMGRKTFESIGKALPGRKNIVVSRNPVTVDGIIWAQTPSEAILAAGEAEIIFIIGGASIYHFFLPIAHRLEITRIPGNPLADAFFPEIEEAFWELEKEQLRPADDQHPELAFRTYRKKSAIFPVS